MSGMSLLVLSVSHPKVEGLAALIAVEVLIFAWAVTAVTLITGAGVPRV